jgi:hypothetical protein
VQVLDGACDLSGDALLGEAGEQRVRARVRSERHPLAGQAAQRGPRQHRAVRRGRREGGHQLIDERHRGVVREALDVLAQGPVGPAALPCRVQRQRPEWRGDRAARRLDRREQAVPPERALRRARVRRRDEERHRNAEPPEDGPRVLVEVAVGVVEGHEHGAAWERRAAVSGAQHVVERDGAAGAREPLHLALERLPCRAHDARRPAARIADAVVGQHDRSRRATRHGAPSGPDAS